MALRDPDEDEGVRSLLGVVSAGFTLVGLFLAVMSYFEERPGRSVVLAIFCMVGLGLLGLIGAALGRNISRWLLGGFGVVLIGGSAYVLIHSFSFSAGPGLFEVVVVGGMVLFGVSSVAVSWRSIRRHRSPRGFSEPERPTAGRL